MKRAISVSLGEDLLQRVDRLAQQEKVTRSSLIEKAIELYERRRVERQMAEGYLALAEENSRWAEEALESFWEVVKDDKP